MIKRALIPCLLFALLLPAASFAQTFTAVLTGAAEVPGPGDPDGSGVALVTIDGTTIHYSIITRNIGAPTGAHIHRAPAGVEGNVFVAFDASMLAGGSVVGVAQANIDAIVANPAGFYVNVHTAAHPGGAIRGQLMPTATAAGARELFIPVVGKVAGAAGTNFVTDIRILNPNLVPAMVTLEFFDQSTTGHTAPTATTTVTVAAGEQAVINDLIGTLQSTGLGALRVTSDQNVEVRSRVINDLRESGLGTTGFSVAAGSLLDAGLSGTLGFLSTTSSDEINLGIGFRTNIGYFNPHAIDVTATFTARDTRNGANLGSVTITIPPRSFVQQGVFALISSVQEGNRVQPDFYVTWTASAPLFVFGAVVDNKTGDSVLIQ